MPPCVFFVATSRRVTVWCATFLFFFLTASSCATEGGVPADEGNCVLLRRLFTKTPILYTTKIKTLGCHFSEVGAGGIFTQRLKKIVFWTIQSCFILVWKILAIILGFRRPPLEVCTASKDLNLKYNLRKIINFGFARKP